MADLEQRLTAWSHGRQRLGRTAPDAGSVLAELGGVYATQPTAILSLAARLGGFAPDDYRRLDLDRTAVRLPAMRLSSHLVRSDAAAWILAATRRPRETLAWLWRGIGLTDGEYAQATAAILDVAHEPVTVGGIRTALGPQAARLLGTHPQAATLLVRAIRTEGLLVAIAPPSLRANAFAYVATADWLGRPLDEVEPEVALTRLAETYLAAFGPARVEDFRWWAGVLAERAQAAVRAIATDDLGDGLLLRRADRAAFAGVAPLDPGTVDLLPLWDMYTMGYAPDGRTRLVGDADRGRAYDRSGNGLGLVLAGGVAAATWGLRFTGRTMEVDLDPFGTPSKGLRRAIEARLGEAAQLLGAADLRIVDGPPRGPGGPG